MESRLDIIIFGATGFTGKRTIPHLSKIIKFEELPLTWGIAGRTHIKLEKALAEMSQLTGENYSDIPIICADVHDTKSIQDMTAHTKILINTVGPYISLGEKVVEACIKSGTHYVDISGELQFIAVIKSKYHKSAMEKGIYLISACGLGSIPPDLGVIFLQKNFEGTLNSTECYLYTEEKGPSGQGSVGNYTTYKSAIYGLTHFNELRVIESKFNAELLSQVKPMVEKKGLVFKSTILNKWSSIYPGFDLSVMLWTQRFLYETYKQKSVQIQIYFCYNSFLQMVTIIFVGALVVFICKLDWARSLLLKYPKFFTGGEFSLEEPSEERQENTHVHIILIGKGWKDKLAQPTHDFTTPPRDTLIAKVTARNPYGSTCLCLALAAIMVLTESDRMPNNGGCYSPGAAFANTSLIKKLHKYGIKFELNPEL